MEFLYQRVKKGNLVDFLLLTKEGLNFFRANFPLEEITQNYILLFIIDLIIV